MRRGTIFGREVEMQGGPYALAAYRREFSAPLFSDLAKAYEEAPPDLATLLQVAWAMAKTADDATSPYLEWLREFDSREFTLADTAEVTGVIYSAISAELFRGGKTRGWRRCAVRLLGRLERRSRALADWIRP